ncbi:hypothetical protein COU57_00475 [Candidatus Pacearchaeota archaeon CG10_big_fil_rev_8_21_14_0_10_32_14]|nr:MAG: hypothetical protein COU57_00475 [Candidatus Pacearchaeota archaeon CG10_big_fil_rev_8_21_14_0_10_32_14]
MIQIKEVLLRNCKMKPKFRKAVFIVTYAKKNDSILYLVMKRRLNWIGWEFPKGGVDEGEKERNTAVRELKEETDLVPLKNRVIRFKIDGLYKYKKKLKVGRKYDGQSYKLYAIEVEYPKEGKIKIDGHEHSTWKWLNIDNAVKRVTWPNQKKCLKIVDEWLSNKSKN